MLDFDRINNHPEKAKESKISQDQTDSLRNEFLPVIEENSEYDNFCSADKPKQYAHIRYDSPVKEKKEEFTLKTKQTKKRPSSCKPSSNTQKLLKSRP